MTDVEPLKFIDGTEEVESIKNRYFFRGDVQGLFGPEELGYPTIICENTRGEYRKVGVWNMPTPKRNTNSSKGKNLKVYVLGRHSHQPNLTEFKLFSESQNRVKKSLEFQKAQIKTENSYRFEEQLIIDNFFEEFNRIANNSSLEDQLEFVADKIDDQLIKTNFGVVDDILLSTDIKNYNLSVLISFLAITIPWKEKLRKRENFLGRLVPRIVKEKDSSEAAKLIEWLG